MTCDSCEGAGEYHDCGEDTCCCADQYSQDMVICADCGGDGYIPGDEDCWEGDGS